VYARRSRRQTDIGPHRRGLTSRSHRETAACKRRRRKTCSRSQGQAMEWSESSWSFCSSSSSCTSCGGRSCSNLETQALRTGRRWTFWRQAASDAGARPRPGSGSSLGFSWCCCLPPSCFA